MAAFPRKLYSLGLAVLAVLSSSFCSTRSETNPDFSTLKLVQVIFRHGDRAPTETYPTDPYANISVYWPLGLGQLTDVGERQQYDLGLYLRARYGANGYLSPNYVQSEIEVLTSDMYRTIMSVQSNLAGLYKPSNLSANWNSEIPWTPVPFRTIPKYEDNFLQMDKAPCPRLTELRNSIPETEYFQQMYRENYDLIEYLRIHAGYNETEPLTILKVGDVLVVNVKHNLTLPAWATIEVVQQLEILMAKYSVLHTLTPEMKRLTAGPLLKTILSNCEKVVNRSAKNLKLVMYSAHDSTLLRLMDTLGVFKDMIMPPYASMWVAELHHSQSVGFWVEMLYRNDSTKEPNRLTLPGCTFQCPLADFLSLTSEHVPGDWDKECLSQNKARVHILILVLIALGLVGIGVLLMYCAFRKRTKYNERKLSINHPGYNYNYQTI